MALDKQLQEVVTLFFGITVEAFPFVVLGILVSLAIQNLPFEKFVSRFIPKNRYFSHFFIALFGVFMPVCECGNIPVARQMLQKGLKVSHVITFLLSAPILNPITFWSTYAAFSYDKTIVVYRMLGGFLIASIIGIIFSFKKNQHEFLDGKFYETKCCITHIHHKGKKDIKSKLVSNLDYFVSEFGVMFKMLTFGAAVAALSQAFIPREVIVSLGYNPILSILSMMLLAFVISICSTVDAFLALSYANTFTKGSIVSFLIFGPMVDMKIFTMLKSTFKVKFLVLLSVLVALFTIFTGLLINLIG